MNEDLIRALVTIGFGALAGGLTNSVAIWMLFHPYEPPRILRWTLNFFQGAVPKNQARLASAIGRTVGNRLLTEEDLTRTFADVEFRSAFDERLSTFFQTLLQHERGSLSEMLPTPVLVEVESVMEDVEARVLERFQEYLQSDAFEEFMSRRAGDLLSAVEDEPVAGILTPAREDALASAVDDWLAGAVEADGFQHAIDDYLDRAAHRLLEPGRTFEEILPLGLVGSVEMAIQSYLPLAIERLGGLLEDPKARARFESTLHDILHRFLRDLNFYQRVVASLIVTEDTVDKVLDVIEREGTERLSEMLRDQAVQDVMAKGVNDAIVDFLRRPVSSVFGEPDDPNVQETKDTLSGWAIQMARDPNTRAFLVEKLHSALDRAGARTWGEVLDNIPPERVSEWLVTFGRSDAAATMFRKVGERMSETLLDTPIGRPANWLPPEAPDRIEEAIGDPVWDWLQTQVPDVVHRINVAGRVEQKVLEFPTPRMEELIKRVTHRELRLIVRLGYVLGGVIGTVLVVLNLLMS